MDSKHIVSAMAVLAMAIASQSASAEDITWQGLNYNLGSVATNISDGANWSSGTVPGPDDSVQFLYYGYDGFMGGSTFATRMWISIRGVRWRSTPTMAVKHGSKPPPSSSTSPSS
ncbi:MAG: hypothetical protein ACOX9C_09995 [Kiritimatiellia bacterium]|jgi:hypothetical protein